MKKLNGYLFSLPLALFLCMSMPQADRLEWTMGCRYASDSYHQKVGSQNIISLSFYEPYQGSYAVWGTTRYKNGEFKTKEMSGPPQVAKEIQVGKSRYITAFSFLGSIMRPHENLPDEDEIIAPWAIKQQCGEHGKPTQIWYLSRPNTLHRDIELSCSVTSITVSTSATVHAATTAATTTGDGACLNSNQVDLRDDEG